MMNGSGKQSFYEIQLSNSSLVVAFVIAVALGIAVFVLGVTVGKGQAPQQPLLEDFGAADPGTEGAVEDLSGAPMTAFDDTQQPVGSTPAAAAVTAPPQEAEPDAEIIDPMPRAEAEQEAPPPAASQPAASLPSGLPENDPALASGWVVQVKATPNREEADELQAALASAGFPAFVVSEETRGQRLHKVRVGRYRTRDEAQRIQTALSTRTDVADTWVTEG